MNNSRCTNAIRNAQDTIREFGTRNITSTATFFLPQKVEENALSTVIDKLGFLDNTEATVKANGLAIQVQMLAIEDIPSSLFEKTKPTGFEAVKVPTPTVATVAPASGSSGI